MSSRSLVLALLVISVSPLACGDDDGGRPGADSLGPLDTTGATTGEPGSDDEPATSSTPGSTSGPDDTTGATPGDTSATTDADTSTGDTLPPSSICDDVIGESLVPPSVCDGPGGNTSTEVPPNGLYSTSWFGCYFEEDGSLYMDPGDNCEFACGNMGLCPAGQDGPNCEANLRWFAADADRYGCGGRIRVTNCDNGNAVVLVTLDRGPNCNSVEMACDTPVLDMSHDAMVHLFDGGTYGGCEHQTVVVEAVDPGTPLGPA